MKNEECDETTMLGRRKRAGSYVSQDTIYKREMQKRKKKSEEKRRESPLRGDADLSNRSYFNAELYY